MRSNNFDPLRSYAAMAVLVSHAFSVSYGSEAMQPLAVLSHGQTNLGAVAVLVFFVISGYLITRSYDRSPHPVRFLKARLLRILPGLLFAAVFTVAVLGPMVTSRSIPSYLIDRATIGYIPKALALYDGGRPVLPGVFTENPFPNTVNGSLWTLQYEFTMYLAVLALGLLGLLHKHVVLALWVVLAAVSFQLSPLDDHYSSHKGYHYVEFGLPFVSGALLYLWRDRVPLDWRLAVGSLVALIAALIYSGFPLAFATSGAYLVIFLALALDARLRNLTRNGDLSYGVYIYAFPVQQTGAYVLGSCVEWYWNIAFSVPIVLGLAWLSWHLVEKRALSLR
jgi:peptidoglycan/LPS O-acetylase OafA/YrhL